MIEDQSPWRHLQSRKPAPIQVGAARHRRSACRSRRRQKRRMATPQHASESEPMKVTRPRKAQSENLIAIPTRPGKSADGLDRNSRRLQSREKAILPRISHETTRLGREREGLRLVMPSRVKMHNRGAEPRNQQGLMIVARLPRKQHRARSPIPGTRRVKNRIKRRNSARNGNSSQSSARSLEDDA